MLKISKIEYFKNVYDESLSHNVFSTANIEFSNATPIYGALLYWQENKDDKPFTKDGEYKFFYDLDDTKYFASVKFPKHCTLTTDQQQELAYILIEQRGHIGSYSIQTNRNAAKFIEIKKRFKQLHFPAQFSTEHFQYTYILKSSFEKDELIKKYPFYSESFITNYIDWLEIVYQAHPSQFENYIAFIPFKQLCTDNPYLTEQFIIRYFDKIDFSSLQFNLPVIQRLSRSFRAFIVDQVKNDEYVQKDIEESTKKFIENDLLYEDSALVFLPKEDEEDNSNGPFYFFEYDRGSYIWPGSEHLIRTIPSFAKQIYNEHGDRLLLEDEMHAFYFSLNSNQRFLFETSCDLHWIHIFREDVNWQHVCEWNPNLTADFIEHHINFVSFEALAKNTKVKLPLAFIDHYMFKLSKSAYAPLLIAHLNVDLFEKHKEMLQQQPFNPQDYEAFLPIEQIELVERLFNNE